MAGEDSSKESARHGCALKVSGLVKNFPGVQALDGVDFDLRHGEVHAVLGENGAGKSSLMNILSGLLRPDAGTMELWGREHKPASPREASLAGVGMVHQHFMLIPAMTVAENIALGFEPGNRFYLNPKPVVRRLRELSETLGMPVDPNTLIRDLPVGIRQRVEILKAFYRNARLLILDEPTALLTPSESRELLTALKKFVKTGLSVIFVSHKLEEVLNVSQRVTVLRRGKTVGVLDSGKASPAELARMMVGREVKPSGGRRSGPVGNVGKPLLKVKGLSAKGFHPFDLEIREGEILGVAGVEGNGQEELARALGGALRSRGSIRLDGQPIERLSIRKRREAGLGWIPSDRCAEGLVLDMTAAQNLALRSYRHAPYSKFGLLKLKEWTRQASTTVKAFNVRPPDPGVRAGALSGGNQQKIVIAREVSFRPKALIACQPTRGLDVGAVENVRAFLNNLRDNGCAILMISFDLDEILALSERIAVMYKGKLLGPLAREQADREVLGLMMMGRESTGG